MTNLIGQSIGRYHILEQLGEGGMAIVYKAYDTRLERDMAIKVIRTERLTIETMGKTLKRFEREAKSLAKLTHPNIVSITDYGEHDGKPYLVMPYLPGGTLKQKLGGKQMPWQDAIRLLLPVARALHYAHQQGIVHRDVKPANILITQSGEPMLTDFGIAKILLDTEDTFELTGTGMGIGTPEYMSPEQFQGTNVDARTDVYALGVVLYEMVTGRKPYQADTPAAVLIKQATDPLPRPKSFTSNLPDSVERVLLKALSKQAGERYQDMHQFAQALESIPSQDAPDVVQGVKSRPASGKPWLRWARVGIPILILGIGVWVGRDVFIPALGSLPDASNAQPTGAAPSLVVENTPVQSVSPTPFLSIPGKSVPSDEQVMTREEALLSMCGTEHTKKLMDEYSIVFFNDFSKNMNGLESWGADAKISNGLLVNKGYNYDWKAVGRAATMTSGKAVIMRFRSDSPNDYKIYVEQPAYGKSTHRWWGISANKNDIEPIAYFGQNFSSQPIDWQQNDLLPTSDWLCVFISIDKSTFSARVWMPSDPAQFAFTAQEMGKEWENFQGASAFASLYGSLEMDVFSELSRK